MAKGCLALLHFIGLIQSIMLYKNRVQGLWLHGRGFACRVLWVWFPALKNTNGGGVADRTEGGNVESETSNVQHHMSSIIH